MVSRFSSSLSIRESFRSSGRWEGPPGPDTMGYTTWRSTCSLSTATLSRWDAMTPEQAKAHDAAHASFRAAAGSKIVGSEELELAPMATTVRSDSVGNVVTTDGPFLGDQGGRSEERRGGK